MDESQNKSTIYVSGYAGLPKEVTESIAGVTKMYMSWEVNPKEKKIIKVLCTLTQYALMPENFISSLFTGYSLSGGIDDKVNEINERCHGPLKKPLIGCTRDTYRTYTKYKKHSTEES